MKRLVKSAGASTEFAQQMLSAASELESALVSLKTAYRGYEAFKNATDMPEEQFSEFVKIAEGIEYQFEKFTVNADDVELKTCAEQMVEFLNRV